MVGYRSNVRRYFDISKEEWLAILTTAVAGGFIFSFNDWGETVVELAMGFQNLLISFIAVFLLLTFQVSAWKLAGVRYGLKVEYDKYALGLLFGLFIAFLSFGFLPFFITGRLNYSVIPNLRVGKFRAALPKHWEMGLVSAAGPLALILLTIPLRFLGMVSGLALFQELILIAVLLAFYCLLPLPLIETANPYTVYMSRIEALKGGLPGLDIFYASAVWYVFFVAMTAIFAFFALVWTASLVTLLFSIVLGFAFMFIYMKSRYHFSP